MQQNQSALGAARLLDVSYDGMMGAENYWLSDYLETKPVLGIGKFVVLFALYLLVAGPGFYVLFQKTGKRTWMFSAVPAVALAFFVFVAAAGSDTRVTKPYASYTELIEQNENTAEAQLAVQLAAPAEGHGMFLLRENLMYSCFREELPDFMIRCIFRMTADVTKTDRLQACAGLKERRNFLFPGFRHSRI